MIDFPDFYSSLCNQELDRNLLKKAFLFAREKHTGQIRKISKLPYFTHPISVSQLLQKFDTEVISTGLLHDVLEDTETTVDEMRTHFGDTITNLVVGMTKVGDIITPLKNAAIVDKRVLLVKLADRLDNLSDGILDMKRSTQLKYLSETPKILDLAQQYGINTFCDAIETKLNYLVNNME